MDGVLATAGPTVDLRVCRSSCGYFLSFECIIEIGGLRNLLDLWGKIEEGWKEWVDEPESAFLS